MDKPKKIVVDLGKLKNRFSGLGEVSFNFGKALSENIPLLEKMNMEIHLLVPPAYVGAFGNELKYIPLGFFRRHLPFLFKPYDLWYAIHQDSGYRPGYKKTKYILGILDLNFMYEKREKKIRRRKKRLQHKIDRANYITTISDFGGSEVKKYFEAAGIPIETIYCGVADINHIQADKPKEMMGYENFFMHISTLMPKKNIAVLPAMMKLMPEKKLVIAGSWDNDYAKNILAGIKEDGIDNIIPLSKVSDAEKAWLFQNCEAFFFPSFFEGFGLPVIEAFYCGKPVFASTFTSLPEIGSDKAFYWKNFDPLYMKEIVLEKMEAVKNDPGFTDRVQQYAATFTWQKNVSRYISLFNELLS